MFIRKKVLTAASAQAENLSPVLNTPHLAAAAPDRHSGIFTSMAFAMAGRAQLYNSLRAKAASRLSAVLKVPPPLFRVVNSTIT
jgi:hypothetical protein